MILGDIARKRLHFLTFVIAGLASLATPQAAFAAAETAAPQAAGASVADAASPNVADATAPAAQAAEGSTAAAAPAGGGYTPLGPEWIKGQPVDGGIDFQPQFTDDGAYAYKMHTYILLPIITAVSLLVLGLLLYVVARYNRRRNPLPSKTSHNTVIEVIWTVVPVLILVVIAVPSITLLADQFKSPPKNALTMFERAFFGIRRPEI